MQFKKLTKEIGEYAQLILDNINEGVFSVNKSFHILYFNKAAENITGVSAEKAIGQYCYDVFKANICENNCLLCKTMESGEPISDQTVYILNATGERVPISISTAVLLDDENNLIGAVETFRDMTTIFQLREELENSYIFGDMVSKSSVMKRIFSILPQVAESSSSVLICGKSGTGKELVARAVHKLSHRRDKPMVTVNCGALPDSLLESELFGYKAGAFTDAKIDRAGRFAEARGGTLFLDEIGDISPAFQVKLLRVLQEKAYQPLGSDKMVKADVRLICATNKNLKELIEQGKFRQDLFYRINVIKISLPTLKERKEDIPYLVNCFLKKYRGITGKSINSVHNSVMRLFMQHDFPGNVRELENIIEHAFVLCNEEQITTENLPDTFAGSMMSDFEVPNHQQKDSEAERILSALEAYNWNRTRAAQALGMHKATLFRKVKKLGISLPAQDGRNTAKKQI